MTNPTAKTNDGDATDDPAGSGAVSRRTVLAGMSAAAVLAGTNTMLPAGAAAEARSLNRAGGPPGQLVVLFLRGGQDHLSAVVPYTDSNYYALRPSISIPAAQVLDLDGTLGFHPSMPGMHGLFQDGRLAVVTGAGNLGESRSHFAAQDLSEYGATAIPPDQLGWLGRYLAGSAGGDDSVFRGLTIGNNVNLSLRGYPALGVPNIETFGLGGMSGYSSGYESLLRGVYAGTSVAESTGTTVLDAIGSIGTISGSTAQDEGARAFADIAALLDGDLGVEVVTYNLGHWDTHDAMGTWDDGEMMYLLSELDSYLANFQADLDARGLTDVTTVVMTEFGRRVFENGSGGCDHGLGSAMYVLGGAVNGGQVFGSIPALTTANIAPHGYDVPIAIDQRDVLCDVAGAVLGLADPASLFPEHVHTPVGVTV